MAYADPQKQREYQRAWMKRRRLDYFGGKFCKKCGASDSLELDHIDPSQKIDHKIWAWRKDRREAEIAKCQILCRPCHQQKSKVDMGYRLIHGKENGYRSYKCRCTLCRGAHSQKMKLYRAGRRAILLRSKKGVKPEPISGVSL